MAQARSLLRCLCSLRKGFCEFFSNTVFMRIAMRCEYEQIMDLMIKHAQVTRRIAFASFRDLLKFLLPAFSRARLASLQCSEEFTERSDYQR
jgi:hypothetical protein